MKKSLRNHLGLSGAIFISSIVAYLTVFLVSGCTTTPTPSPESMTHTPDSEYADQNLRVSRSISRRQFVAVLTEESIRAIHEDASLAEKSDARYQGFIDHIETIFGVRRVAEATMPAVSLFCLLLESDSRFTPEELVRRLTATHYIDSVQSLQLFSVVATPNNDPHRELQRGFAATNAESAHRFATGRGVTVALIDTGVDREHPDIADRISEPHDIVNDEAENIRSDVHGTAIASVIGATRNNGEGMIGIAPDAQIVALEACWPTRPGFVGGICSTYSLAIAVDYALRENADIINLSLTGPDDPLLTRLISRALEKGVIVVGAAGENEHERFPSIVPGVIAVDIDGNGKPGPDTIVAPGRKILAARPGGEYDYFDGRSLAVAHITGLAALARERRPHMTPQEFASLIAGTTDGNSDYCSLIASIIHAEC